MVLWRSCSCPSSWWSFKRPQGSPHLQSFKTFISLNSLRFYNKQPIAWHYEVHVSTRKTLSTWFSVERVLCECACLCIWSVMCESTHEECVFGCGGRWGWLFETWPGRPVGFMKGLFHVPFPSGVWLESSCLNQVFPYAKCLLCYLRILNRSRCEGGEKHQWCVACMFYHVSQTLVALSTKYTFCHLNLLSPFQISSNWPPPFRDIDLIEIHVKSLSMVKIILSITSHADLSFFSVPTWFCVFKEHLCQVE